MGVCSYDLTNVVVAHLLVVLITMRADLPFEILIVATGEVNVVVCFVLAIHTTTHNNPLERHAADASVSGGAEPQRNGYTVDNLARPGDHRPETRWLAIGDLAGMCHGTMRWPRLTSWPQHRLRGRCAREVPHAPERGRRHGKATPCCE